MTGILKSIFAPHDGSRQVVMNQVTESREGVERAATRFEDTIRDLMDKNDRLTGRSPNEVASDFPR